jgi:hypothetical protein
MENIGTMQELLTGGLEMQHNLMGKRLWQTNYFYNLGEWRRRMNVQYCMNVMEWLYVL